MLHSSRILFVFVLVFGILLTVPQATRAALYAPGATLDPACAPTDVNCGIISAAIASSTINSIPYYAANGSLLSATSTITILSDGNVGIGTTTPTTKLSVYTGASGGTSYPGTSLAVESAGDNYIQMLSGAASGQGLLFGTAINNTRGYIEYLDSTDAMHFGTINTERMRIDATGNIGIATTSPWARLSADTTGLASGVPSFAVGSSTRTDMVVTQFGNVGFRTSNPVTAFDLEPATGQGIALGTGSYPSWMGTAGIYAQGQIYALSGYVAGNGNGISWGDSTAGILGNSQGASGFLNLETNSISNITVNGSGNVGIGGSMATISASLNGAAMTVLSTGNVGIGTSSPAYRLDVGYSSGLQNTPGLSVHNDAAGPGREAAIWLSTPNNAGNDRNWGFVTNHSADGDYEILNSDGPTTKPSAVRMTMDYLGNVGFGTTTPYANLSVQAADGGLSTTLFAIGSSTATATKTLFSVANTGNVTVNGTSGSTCIIGNGVGATSCTSDERLKTNIALIVDPLKSIEQLRGVTFNWIDPTKNQSQFIGVIAQDVQKVFPQVVTTTPDGYLAVDYAALVAPLIEAVKELSGQVSQLAATVAGFTDTFTTNHLCVKKSDGASVCITGDQLNTILNQNGQTINTSRTSSSAASLQDQSVTDESTTASSTSETTTSDATASSTDTTAKNNSSTTGNSSDIIPSTGSTDSFASTTSSS